MKNRKKLAAKRFFFNSCKTLSDRCYLGHHFNSGVIGGERTAPKEIFVAGFTNNSGQTRWDGQKGAG